MNIRRTLAIFAVVASWALAGCSGGTPPAASRAGDGPIMPVETGLQLVQMLNQFDPEGLRKLLTNDARLLAPNVPAIEGSEAVVEYYRSAVATELAYEVTQLKSAMIGNVGVAEGTYRIRNRTNDTYVEDGKYLAVWVNQEGQWRIARLMSNTDAQVAQTSVEIE